MTLLEKQKRELDSTITRIIHAAAKVSGASVEDCGLAKRRKPRDVMGRALAVTATQQIVGLSYNRLASRFGYTCHTSCMSLVKMAVTQYPNELRQVVEIANDPQLFLITDYAKSIQSKAGAA